MTELVVLVPALRRPQNVAPLLESFRQSKTPGRLVFITDRDDHAERDAIAKAGAFEIVTDNLGTWPRKIHAGYLGTSEPWMLLGADDVRFWAGWWEATAGLRERFSVIGTNDLGTPRVKAGEHSTHTLVSREYADVQGTIDGPGAVVCEQYGHWFVDDELIATAKSRGAWSPCLGSVVEHRHPYFGRGPMDEVYRLGESRAAEDKRLWEERRKRIGDA